MRIERGRLKPLCYYLAGYVGAGRQRRIAIPKPAVKRLDSARHGSELLLVPNKRMLDLTLAAGFLESSGTVRVAPSAEVFSTWAENLAARICLLDGHAVHGSASGLAQQQAWLDAVSAGDREQAAGQRLLARQAQTANRQLNQWFGGDELPWLDPRFLKWRQAVAVVLARESLFTSEQWFQQLTERLECSAALPLTLPERLVLRGFIEFTRVERELLSALELRGITVSFEGGRDRLGEPAGLGKPKLVAYPTPDDELRAGAAWAAWQVASGLRRVALVIPDLEGRAAQVTRILDRALHPGDALQVANDGVCHYHLPVGLPLLDHPLVADALMLLRFSALGPARSQSFPVPSRLILSPVTQGAVAERHMRGVFESRLREDGRYWLSLSDVRRQLERWNLQHAMPELHQLLVSMPKLTIGDDPATSLLECLLAWGWPGPSARGPLMQTRVNRFVDVLEDLRGLAGGLAAHSALFWLDLLQQACRDKRICERGGPLSSVQVIGPEDAVGQQFEAARILDLHADNWPGRPRANPFLPAQVAQVIPRASHEGMLAHARELQRHLEALADDVTFTWARKAGDAPRLASPLVEAVCAITEEPEADFGPWAAHRAGEPLLSGYAQHPWLEAIGDASGLALEHAGNDRIPGGAGMLQAQSGCPMHAYLRYRLDARFEDMPGPFPDYAWRGSVLHAALHHLYAPHEGRADLPEATDIAQAVLQAMDDGQAAYRLSAAAREAERSRLHRVLRDWLALDRSRPPFRVFETEQQADFSYEGFSIRVRNDRIDQLADGSLLLLDYKSRAVSARDWNKDRIPQPQLPLYAVLMQGYGQGFGGGELSQPLGGLALAGVRPGECKYAGFVHHPGLEWAGVKAPGSIKQSLEQRAALWTQMTAGWEAGIAALIGEIIAGEAGNRVFRKDALKYSGLAAILRRVEGEEWLIAHGLRLGIDEGQDDDGQEDGGQYDGGTAGND